jgi:N-acetylmuramoyl-L-alanine amidase
MYGGIDINDISINKIDDRSFNLVINTSGKGSANITSSLNPSEITLTLKGGTIAGSVNSVKGTHPLIKVAKCAQVSSNSPVARVFLGLHRMVLSKVNVDNDSITVNVCLPEKAGGKLAGRLIVVDAGHGGAQVGAQSRGTQEKNVNFQIAKDLAAALEAQGARVILTRTADSTMDLSPRPAVATGNNADFFISVHCNSNIKPNSASGIETYHYRYGDSSPLLAEAIQKAVCANTGMNDRNARGCNFAVLRYLYNTGIPGVLVECGYINNSSDREKLLSEDYRHQLTQGIVEGLKSYIEGTPVR